MQRATRRDRALGVMVAAAVLTAGAITVNQVDEVPGYQRVRTEHTIIRFDDGEVFTTSVSAHWIVTVGGPSDGQRTAVPEQTRSVASPNGFPGATVETVPAAVIETVPPTTVVRTATATYDSPYELSLLVEASAFDTSVGTAHLEIARAGADDLLTQPVAAAEGELETVAVAAAAGAAAADRVTLEHHAALAGDPVSVATGHLVLAESDLVLTAGAVRLDLRRTHRTSLATDGSVGPGWFFSLDSALILGESPTVAGALARAREALEEAERLRLEADALSEPLVAAATAVYRRRRNEALREAARARNLERALRGLRYSGELADLVAAEADRQAGAAARIAGELEAYADLMLEVVDRVARETRLAVAARLDALVAELRAVVGTMEEDYELSRRHAALNDRFATLGADAFRTTGTDSAVVVGTSGIPRRYVRKTAEFVPAEPGLERLRRVADGTYVVERPGGPSAAYGRYGELRSLLDRNGNGFTFLYDESDRLVRIEDSRGGITTLERTALGRLAAIVAPDGARTSYDYDSAGRLAAVTDPVGDRTAYRYEGSDDEERVVGVIRPDGSSRRYRYERLRGRWHTVETVDEVGGLERFDFTLPGRTGYTNPGGLQWWWVFDERNRTILIEKPGGGSEAFGYDEHDRLIRSRSPAGEVTLYEYDERGNRTAVIYPDGTSDAWNWSEQDTLLASTDRRGQVTRYEYDERGNRTAVIHADRTTDRFTVVAAGAAAGSPAVHTDRRGNRVRYAYDEAGFLSSVHDELGVVELRQSDLRGRPVRLENGSGGVIGFTYRADGTLALVAGPGDRTVRYEYNSRKDLIAVDEDGRRTTIEYDARHLPVRVRSGAGADIYHYRADGLMTAWEVVGTEGARVRRLDYTYDARGLVQTTAVAGLDTVTRFEHDAADRLSAIVDPTGVRTEYRYTFDGLPTARTLSGGGLSSVWTYTQLPGGPLSGARDPNGATTTWTHDAAARSLTERGPDGARTVTWHDPYGLPLRRTDETGRTEWFTYDLRGRLTAMHNDLHRVVTYAYDESDRIVAVTDGEGVVRRYSYDERGRVVRIVNPDGTYRRAVYAPDGSVMLVDETGVRARYEYDDAGRLSTVHHGPPEAGTVTTISWSARGMATGVTDPAGAVSSLELDEGGRVVGRTDGAGSRTSYALDSAGRLLLVTDPTDRTTSFGYDGLGRLVERRRADRTEARHDYDAAGRLVAEHDGLGILRRYEYDAAGRLVLETDRSGAHQSYRYDAAGRLAERLDFNGLGSSYEYDGAGRLSQVLYADGSFLRYRHDRADRFVVAENESERLELHYDEGGRLSQLRAVVTGTELAYVYDAAGRLVHRRDGTTGSQTSYAHDERGLLVAIEDTVAGLTRLEYDAAARRTVLQAPNGVRTTTRYDENGAVAAIVVTGPTGSVVEGVAFVRDAAGRRLYDVDHEGLLTAYRYDAAGRIEQVAYPYDGPKRRADLDHLVALGVTPLAGPSPRSLPAYLELDHQTAESISRAYRLVTPLGKPEPPLYRQVWTERFAYDAAGNRVSWLTGWGDASTTYDAARRLASTGGTVYRYDEAGNLTREEGPQGVTAYSYTAQNRLLSVTTGDATVTYAYDPLGRRIIRAESDSPATLRKPSEAGTVRYSIYRYDGAGFAVSSREDILLAGPAALELDSLVKPPAHAGRYLPADPAARVARLTVLSADRFTELTVAGRTISISGYLGSLYLSHDTLGSPRVTTDRAGEVVERYRYDAYGELLAGSVSHRQPYGYGGRPRDSVTGSHDYGLRDYLPRPGRFATPDPIRYGTNWYVFVDPVNTVDLLGLAPVSDLDAAGTRYMPGSEYRFMQMRDQERSWIMQDDRWLAQRFGGGYTIGEYGCKIVSGAIVASALVGDGVLPETVAALTDQHGFLTRDAIAGATLAELPAGSRVETTITGRGLAIETIVALARDPHPRAVIGRARLETGDHFVVLEGFWIGANGEDVIFGHAGSSLNDASRTYTLSRQDPGYRVYRIDRIETFRVAGMEAP